MFEGYSQLKELIGSRDGKAIKEASDILIKNISSMTEGMVAVVDAECLDHLLQGEPDFDLEPHEIARYREFMTEIDAKIESYRSGGFGFDMPNNRDDIATETLFDRLDRHETKIRNNDYDSQTLIDTLKQERRYGIYDDGHSVKNDEIDERIQNLGMIFAANVLEGSVDTSMACEVLSEYLEYRLERESFNSLFGSHFETRISDYVTLIKAYATAHNVDPGKVLSERQRHYHSKGLALLSKGEEYKFEGQVSILGTVTNRMADEEILGGSYERFDHAASEQMVGNMLQQKYGTADGSKRDREGALERGSIVLFEGYLSDFGFLQRYNAQNPTSS